MDVGVEYLGFEEEFGGCEGVVGGEADVDFEDPVGVGAVIGAVQEEFPGEDVGLVEDEEEVGVEVLGDFGGLFHQSLLIHVLFC